MKLVTTAIFLLSFFVVILGRIEKDEYKLYLSFQSLAIGSLVRAVNESVF